MGVRLDPLRFEHELDRRGLNGKRLSELTGIDESTIGSARHGKAIRQKTATRLVHVLLTQPVIPGAELLAWSENDQSSTPR